MTFIQCILSLSLCYTCVVIVDVCVSVFPADFSSLSFFMLVFSLGKVGLRTLNVCFKVSRPLFLCICFVICLSF